MPRSLFYVYRVSGARETDLSRLDVSAAEWCCGVVGEWITRHPKTVVAAWIVIALLAAPLFASLSKVVKTQQYSLPPSAEASKADKLIEKVKGGSPGFGLVLVQGVDLHDNDTLLRLARWGSRYNQSLTAKGLAKNPVGVPIMLAKINKTLYETLLENITAAAKQMRQLYSSLDKIENAYKAALENTTRMLKRLNETAAAVAAADRGYAQAYRGLLEAANATLQVAKGLEQLDKAYVNATDRLLEAARRLNETAALLSRLDAAYAGLARNVTAAYQRLLAAYGNRTLLERIAGGLAFAWWQDARTYVIMRAVGGNYSLYAKIANLTGVDPRLAPLPPREAEAVYAAVSRSLNKTGDLDRAALLVAEKQVGEKLPANAKPLVAAIAEAWLAEAKKEAASYNSTSLAALIRVDPRNPKATAEAQLLVLRLARAASEKAVGDVAGNAARLAAQALAEILENKGIPAAYAEKLAESLASGKGVNTTLLARLVVEEAAEKHPELAKLAPLIAKTLVSADPEARGTLAESHEAALGAAEKLLEAMGVPREAAEAAARLLQAGASRREAAREALKLLQARLEAEKPEAARLLPVLARYDPEARGLLARDRELLAKAAAEVVAREAAARGARLEPEALEQLARMVLVEGVKPREAARRLALQLVAREAAEKAGKKQAEMLVKILEAYDPEARGLLAENHTLALGAVIGYAKKEGMVPANVSLAPGLVEKLLGNETFLRRYVGEELLRHVLPRVPEEARPVVERFVALLEERGPGLGAEEKWRFVTGAAAEMIAAKAGLPRGEAERFSGVAARVARGEEGPEAAARRLAEKLLVERVAPRLLNETRALLVSRRLDGFVVMFTPLGAGRDERAGNTARAASLAEKLLREQGVAYSRVLASGSDLLMKEVHEYALRDAEKTSKISETATFIVLLLILESVFAVLMPYVGIVLGLMVGGALVYLAARAGIVTVDSTAHSLMITTALGLGADYAAYLVHRFREEVAKGREQREAAAHALATAGPAILASALTVIIGFGSLLLGWDISFLRGLGETIPITVAATAAASLTLVPALLSLIGGRRWFWWPRRPSRERHAERESRLMRRLHRHHRVVLAALLAAMLAGGYFYATFKGSHDMKLLLPENAEAMQAFRVLQKDYMPGLTDPVYVAAVLPQSYWNSSQAQRAVAELADSVRSLPGVGKVLAPNATAGRLMGGEGMVSRDGRVALLQVILAVDPYSDNGTRIVEEIHDRVHSVAEKLGVEVYVGGAPYATLEMDHLLHQRYYYRILPAASTLMVLVFTLIFGSLPASIAALLVIIGSAMMGIAASVVLFQGVLGKGVPWFLHIVSMMAVMGVGMDYNSFFLARALEECQRLRCSDTEEALAKATGAVGLFVIGLAFVVSSAYLSMLSASNIGMQAMGFTLGVTILLAGVMAGYLFTPLVIAMLGEKAWWPWGMKKKVKH